MVSYGTRFSQILCDNDFAKVDYFVVHARFILLKLLFSISLAFFHVQHSQNKFCLCIYLSKKFGDII